MRIDWLQARQKWHITLDRSFPATVNLRNEAMMKEAGEFATHLRRCEKDIRTLKSATEGDAAFAPGYPWSGCTSEVQTNLAQIPSNLVDSSRQ